MTGQSGLGQSASPTLLPLRQLEPGAKKDPRHSSSAKMGLEPLVWQRRHPRGTKTDGLSQLVIDVNGDAVSVATEVTRPTRLLALIGLTEVHGRANEMCTLLAR